MKNIRDLTLEELETIMIGYGEKKYRASQIYSALHKNKIEDFDKISNISNDLKNKIKDSYLVFMPCIEKEFISKLDETKKYLIKLIDGYLIESVLMKYSYGYTVCISSEVGCDMGCKFCASTIGGLKRNLEINELLAQIYLIEARNNINISNIVVMGSGEPLCNLENIIKFLKIINSKEGRNISFRNVTISTCGIVPNILKLAKQNFPLTLALSLHAPNDEIREKIMPISKKYNLHETMLAMATYYKTTNRRITFEYSLIYGINDNEENAKMLYSLLKKYLIRNHIDFNINLIPINPVKECNFKRPDAERIFNFKKILENNNINVTIRRELGSDISGSCGQLRAGVK